MTQWEFDSLIALLNTDVELIDRYIGKSKKIRWRCKQCGGEFESFPNQLLEGRLHNSKSYYRCRWGKCLVKNKTKVIQIVNEIYQNTKNKFLLLSLYRDDATPIKTQCLLCGKTNEFLPNDLRKKKICCTFCNSKQLDDYIVQKKENIHNTSERSKKLIKRRCSQLSRCFRTGEYLCGKHKREDCLMLSKPYYSPEECDTMIKTNNPSLTILSNFIDKKSEISCKCNRCEHIFSALPMDLLNGIHCSRCSASYGEQSIMDYLDSANIKYVREKTFPNCKHYKPLRFDFYLPDYDAVIEYDGKQHYYPVSFAKRDYLYSIEQFELLKKRDSIKNAYCRRYKIPILRIRYDEDVKESLDTFLAKLQRRTSK